MGRRALGKDRVERITCRQKNGDIYVFERTSRYDPEKKYYVTVSSTLLGKLKPGSNDRYDLLPTRPKKKAAQVSTVGAESADESGGNAVQATRKHVGMISIVKRVSDIACIEQELNEILPNDDGLSKKIATLAWYAFTKDGCSWTGSESWTKRYLGDLPYSWTGMSGDMYHDVFAAISNDETIKQGVFANRIKQLGDDCNLVALDSTTIVVHTTKPEHRGKCRLTKHKDGTYQITVKIVFFYSILSRKPIAFSIIPGNIPDSQTVTYALKHMDGLSLNEEAELIFDNGYCSDSNICRCLLDERHFVTRIEADITWVSKEIEKVRFNLEHGGGMIECDPKMSGQKVTLSHKFAIRGKQSETDADEPRSVTKDVNLFIYFSSTNKAKDDKWLRETYAEYKQWMLDGVVLGTEKEKVEKFAKKYMIISRDVEGKIISINQNTSGWEKKLKYSGYLVLLADKEDDLDTALIKFRRREYIEEMIKNFESHVGGDKTRVWDDDTLDGEVFTWFEALTMREAFEKEVNQLKKTLAVPNDDEDHDRAENLKTELELRHWLNGTSLHNILEHFDAIEYVYLKNRDKEVHWTTETSKRDEMFLDKIGAKYEK